MRGDRPVRADGVVVGDEAVDLALQLFSRAGGCWAARYFFIVWWKRSTFPQVWGWYGRECLKPMPREMSSASIAPCPAGAAVKMAPLSDKKRFRESLALAAS